MKISKIFIYRVDLSMKKGSCNRPDQRCAAFDSTVVIIETDDDRGVHI